MWSPMMIKGALMFQDLQLPALLQLVGAVIQENLGSFFPAALPTSPGETAAH